MPRVPDLVRDTQLQAVLENDTVIHSYRVRGVTAYRRSRVEHVCWKTEKEVGKGGFGSVHLQRRIGKAKPGEPDVRAVKQIKSATHKNCLNELEAIAKFSNINVCQTKG
jgi:hypothetical protein